MKTFELGAMTPDIIHFRERLRAAVNDVVVGEEVLLRYSPAEHPGIVRAIIEEAGLEFLGSCAEGEQKFWRPKRVDRWDYAFRKAGVTIPNEALCLDVGCGRKSWPRASYVCDSSEEMKQYALPHQTFAKASVTDHLPYSDKFFDFATCFHVLEHVSDPKAAAAELSRVAKAGLVECPHPAKEGIMLFLESDHNWFVLPPIKPGGPLNFFRIDKKWHEEMQDPEAQGAAYRTFIENHDLFGDKAVLRNYFARVEANLNVIHHWTGELLVVVHE